MRSTPSGEVTLLLQRIGNGDSNASDSLLSLVYDHLRDLAGRVYQGPAQARTLQPTALMHDAYIKLVEREESWDSRQHFYAVASIAMRQMLTDYARARATQKRGGSWQRVSLSGIDESKQDTELDLVALDSALNKLSELSPRQARVVELRFLTGLAVDEVAKIMKVSSTTIVDEWRAARAFLRRELKESDSW